MLSPVARPEGCDPVDGIDWNMCFCYETRAPRKQKGSGFISLRAASL